MPVQLGRTFQERPKPPVPPPAPPKDPEQEKMLRALELLAERVERLPAEQREAIQTPDLSGLITAITSTHPSITAAEIAQAVADAIRIPEPQDNSGLIAEIKALAEKIDFRMKGLGGPAFGSSGPSNIADNPTRELGLVTIKDSAVLNNIKTILENIRDGGTAAETRLDYDARTDGNPVYVGSATNGTATSAAAWSILKLSYDGSARLTRKQILSNQVWDDRASLGWT